MKILTWRGLLAVFLAGALGGSSLFADTAPKLILADSDTLFVRINDFMVRSSGGWYPDRVSIDPTFHRNLITSKLGEGFRQLGGPWRVLYSPQGDPVPEGASHLDLILHRWDGGRVVFFATLHHQGTVTNLGASYGETSPMEAAWGSPRYRELEAAEQAMEMFFRRFASKVDLAPVDVLPQDLAAENREGAGARS